MLVGFFHLTQQSSLKKLSPLVKYKLLKSMPKIVKPVLVLLKKMPVIMRYLDPVFQILKKIKKKTTRKPRKAINSRDLELRRDFFGPSASNEYDQFAEEEEELEVMEASNKSEIDMPDELDTEVDSSQRNYAKGDFIIAQLIYNFSTAKEFSKKFVGCITACHAGLQKNQLKVSFLRKQRAVSIDDNVTWYFTYPKVLDLWYFQKDQIVQKVVLTQCNRGKRIFSNIVAEEIECNI